MAAVVLFFAVAALSGSSALAQDATGTYPATPLASKHFSYPSGIPYKVDTDTGLIRGTQFGYNLCNSTTENQNSLCQTSFLNALDDFCLWAPSQPNSTIADTEGEEVAWCTKKGRGTRLMPEGTLKGVQFIRTPGYLQVTGFIDQTKINIQDGDYGGELDPHGADLRGNPMGGLMYTTGWSSDNSTYTQAIEWHNFMGGNAFCFKICDPSGPNPADLCQHIYDRIGCAYNAPNNAQQGVFESCQGDNQDPPGIYTSGGVVMTYTQPAESLGPITSIPYTARIPASSNCVSFASSALYTDGPTVTTTSSTSANTSKATSKEGSTGGTATSTASGAGAASTGNGATETTISGIAALSVILSALFLS
ncbi:uncharacterized protein BT62DRAFT_916469 [Guyanagaster necrorhizus]|uniref:Macrofage activating glycoprotein n=1 Tax=Guyanagaster necrorhizus TaxID=856835 RepID=A0A9P7W2G0_9AGAR|nr:uncharacterized protein BT62DRAFT_916469 [Guyanagaster necrorhizus MCA 3950]KAG7451468.1 hypothetical protein BT62DRAFT_916469 [Guyanagaster necrorhizus MCA 3950]